MIFLETLIVDKIIAGVNYRKELSAGRCQQVMPMLRPILSGKQIHARPLLFGPLIWRCHNVSAEKANTIRGEFLYFGKSKPALASVRT